MSPLWLNPRSFMRHIWYHVCIIYSDTKTLPTSLQSAANLLAFHGFKSQTNEIYNRGLLVRGGLTKLRDD